MMMIWYDAVDCRPLGDKPKRFYDDALLLEKRNITAENRYNNLEDIISKSFNMTSISPQNSIQVCVRLSLFL